MTIDELCRKLVAHLRGWLLSSVSNSEAEHAIRSVIGPELAAKDVEIERLKGIISDWQKEYLHASNVKVCFLLEDDPPEQHGQPIACTQCWNALSELKTSLEQKSADMNRQLAAACEESASRGSRLIDLEQQVAELRKASESCFHMNAHQHRNDWHPFTRGNNSNHRPLVATAEGWKCADCDYRQPFGHPVEGMMS